MADGNSETYNKKIKMFLSSKTAVQFTVNQFKILDIAATEINNLFNMFELQITPDLILKDKIRTIHNIVAELNVDTKTLTPEEYIELKMTKEEFINFSDEFDGCFIVKEEHPSDFPQRYRVQETSLHKHGYSVASTSKLSNYRRQQLLKQIIEMGKEEKGYVVWQLQQYIKDNKNKKCNAMAVAKWEMDLEFVLKL